MRGEHGVSDHVTLKEAADSMRQERPRFRENAGQEVKGEKKTEGKALS